MVIRYSIIMAIIFFNLTMVAIGLLRKKTVYIAKYGTFALILFALLGIARIAMPFSFGFTYVIHSFDVFPWVRSVLQYDILGSGLRLEEALLLAWAIGSAVFLLKNIRIMAIHTRRRGSYRQSDNSFACGVAQKLRLKRAVIIVSPDVKIPYVTGLFRAHIYLPELEMPEDMLEMVLKHEYQHFKSCDILIKAFYLVLSIALWWNPIVHMFQRELDCLLEIRCDAAITKRMSKEEKLFYLHSLVGILEYVKSGGAVQFNASAFSGAEQSGAMEQRFRLIKAGKAVLAKSVVSVLAAVLIFFASFLVAIQPAYEAPYYDGMFSITPENSHIVLTSDGRHRLYVYGQFVVELAEEILLENENFADLLIVRYVD